MKLLNSEDKERLKLEKPPSSSCEIYVKPKVVHAHAEDFLLCCSTHSMTKHQNTACQNKRSKGNAL